MKSGFLKKCYNVLNGTDDLPVRPAEEPSAYLKRMHKAGKTGPVFLQKNSVTGQWYVPGG